VAVVVDREEPGFARLVLNLTTTLGTNVGERVSGRNDRERAIDRGAGDVGAGRLRENTRVETRAG